jgi:hypothetical protein
MLSSHHASTDPSDAMSSGRGLLADKHSRFRGLYDHDLAVRILGLKKGPTPTHGASGTRARDKVIYLAACLCPDLRACGEHVSQGVVRVLELKWRPVMLVFGHLLLYIPAPWIEHRMV